MNFEHDLDIQASPATVWALTTDIEGWPTLMDTVTTARWLDGGELRVGRRALLKQPGQRPTVWTVTHVEPERHFQWEARVFGVTTKGIHRITPTEHGCRNSLVLELSGRGSGVMGRLLGGRLRKVLTTENDAFRRAAETGVGTAPAA